MACYVITTPSTIFPQEAYVYMADLRNFAQGDKGVLKVEQITGSSPSLGTVFDMTIKGFDNSTSTPRYVTLTANWVIASMNLVLSKVFNKSTHA